VRATDGRGVSITCHNSGFTRKMRTWVHFARRTRWGSASRRRLGALSLPLVRPPRLAHRPQWPSYAESIGDQFTLTSAAAATTKTTRRTSLNRSFSTCSKTKRCGASRARRRFRSFLLGALKRCLADEQMQRHTLKRGGRIQFISTDDLEAEELHHLRADHEAAPDEILDARWAGVVLERALEKVRAECVAEGKVGFFEALSPFLEGTKPHVSYQEVADRMGLGSAQ